MSWTLAEKPKTVLVTRAIAREFAEMERLPRDRELSERRLLVYERLLKAGRFRPVTWASCACKETGTTYRVNGKHTSTLLSKQSPMPEFYAVIERYAAGTLEDAVQLYSTFDSKMQSRNCREINLSFASVVPELAEVPTLIVSLAVGGINYSMFHQDAWARSAAERAELLLDHVEYTTWLHRTLGSPASECRFMARMPVAAAMHTSFGRSRGDARTFWDAVRDQTGTKPDLPDRVLALWLLQHNVRHGQGATKKPSRQAGNKEFLVKCLHAWNAWRKGTTTDLKYFAKAGVPAAL